MMKAIIYGTTGQCRVNYEILHDNLYEVVALVSDDIKAKNPLPIDIPLFLGLAGLCDFIKGLGQKLHYNIAIGNPHGQERVKIAEALFREGLEPARCQAQYYRNRGPAVDNTVQVMPGVTIMPGCILDDHIILNTGCQIDHDCKLEDGVEICPGAILCGEILVKKYATIGAGAVVLPRITIGSNAMVGAGSVVTKDVMDGRTVYGNPAVEH